MTFKSKEGLFSAFLLKLPDLNFIQSSRSWACFDVIDQAVIQITLIQTY